MHTRTIVDPNVGGKLTGKVGRTTLGVLVADDAAPGKRDDPFDPGFGQSAQVLIGRARYDLYAESHIGAIVTDREFLDGYSRVGGVDGQFRLGQTNRFNFVAVQSTHRDEAGNERSGPMGGVSVGYRWWPENWLISWGPRVSYQLSYNHDGIREDESRAVGLNLQFAKNIGLNVNANRLLERFGGIDFHRTNYNVFSNVNTSRLFDRLLIRNITEYNSFAKTIALNLLATYRINALTVFYVGYDDHYRQLEQFYDEFFPGTEFQRTNRAFFTKLQYLFRY